MSFWQPGMPGLPVLTDGQTASKRVACEPKRQCSCCAAKHLIATQVLHKHSRQARRLLPVATMSCP